MTTSEAGKKGSKGGVHINVGAVLAPPILLPDPRVFQGNLGPTKSPSENLYPVKLAVLRRSAQGLQIVGILEQLERAWKKCTRVGSFLRQSRFLATSTN